MTILTTKEVKSVATSTKEPNKLAIEIDLDAILAELNSGLPCDINNAW